MKNISTLVLLFILNSSSPFAQTTLDWQKTYGGTLFEQLGNWSNDFDAPDHSIVSTPDNGFIFCGNAQSIDGDLTSNNGSDDFWIVKSDSAGNIQWQKSYGGSGSDQATSIVHTSDNGYAVCGFSASNDSDISENYGSFDIVVFKLDSSGNIVWQKNYGGSSIDKAFSISQTIDGGYIIGGLTYSNDSDVTFLNGNSDFWLIKTDSSGTLVWEKTFGGGSEDWANSVKQTIDNGFVIAGWTRSSDGDVSMNHGLRDCWIVKTDSLGNLIWEKTFGGSSEDCISSIINVNTGGYAFSGFSSSLDGDVTGGHGGFDFWIVKIDNSGTLSWQKTFGGSDSDEAYDIIQTSDSGFILSGASSSNDGDVTLNQGTFDFWIVKTNIFGDFQWQQSLGGNGGEWAIAAIEASDKGIIVVGSTSSTSGDVTSNHGGWDLWITKITTRFNVVRGTLFVDINSNGILDSGEILLPHRSVQDNVSGRKTFTNNSGEYYLTLVDTGIFDVELFSFIPYYNVSPASIPGSFSQFNETDSLNDFALTPLPGINDLVIALTPITAFRPGFNATYNISYNNVGTTSLTPTIVFYLDSGITFVSSTVAPDIISADSIVWYLPVINPMNSGSLNITVSINSNIPIGSIIHSSAGVDAGVTDETPFNNYDSWESILTGAIDPNDKQVSSTIIRTDELVNPDYLNYIVRFQNTGTDTAFTVSIKDEISPLLDISTFEFVSSSHNVDINYAELTRLMTFTYHNILLADSNINEALSHGFIHYRIKPISTLQVNDIILNTASIYFDFNSPVITNTVNTIISFPDFIDELGVINRFIIYPNPSSDFINISPINKSVVIQSLEIFDIVGAKKSDQIEVRFKENAKIYLSNLSKGIYTLRIKTNEGVYTKKLIKN